jgi:RNA polymerase sigma factor (sigma-70 family)
VKAIAPEGLGEQLADDLDGAFSELVTIYQSQLYSTAYRLCGDCHDAHDLTAEALLRAYRALRDYDAPRLAALELRPWLITILLNLRRNEVRTLARRPQQAAIEEIADLASTAESTEARVLRRELHGQLAQLLLELPERQRVGVVLRHVVGLSYEELAGIWSCPTDTAKSHVHRGLKRLRALLEHKEETHDVND